MPLAVARLSPGFGFGLAFAGLWLYLGADFGSLLSLAVACRWLRLGFVLALALDWLSLCLSFNFSFIFGPALAVVLRTCTVDPCYVPVAQVHSTNANVYIGQ